MGIINSLGRVFNSVATSPLGNALLTSASRRLSAAGLPFGGLFGAQDQNFAINSFDRQGDETDWRVKLTLGGAQNNPLATEMQQPVLQPLAEFGGVVFPITPTILVQHVAHYNAQGLVHTNYPYYAYENSRVGQMTITGEFFVQNSLEAKYWVAAVHFLRSVTKMSYGEKSPNRGQPPPVLFLNGYGDYTFNQVPVIITNFQFDLKREVDYISTGLGKTETAFEDGYVQSSLEKYAWAPSESMITVEVVPQYSRNQISKFNLRDFVNGDDVLDGKGFI